MNIETIRKSMVPWTITVGSRDIRNYYGGPLANQDNHNVVLVYGRRKDGRDDSLWTVRKGEWSRLS